MSKQSATDDDQVVQIQEVEIEAIPIHIKEDIPSDEGEIYQPHDNA